ncbi:hypothetical protein ABO04_10680 [Nitrosomonas sp. HPC101]|uniref:hypothetical protein n=1 Tax=Nitrosomonas sp. HPC101 TaxID=1658667 RepID=UPI001367EAA7|nr:hypothetical protein [Nitrosomonas sp. HPC101]MXS86343.1 hypothetical protein [Nitrosomonas sp. HPC101]
MKSLGDLTVLLDDFRKVVALAGVSFPTTALSFETLPFPHKPPSALPSGKMAVYVFVWNGRCLKVGKVGQKSQARFTSQHYSPASSNSNLAKSLVVGHGKLGLSGITESNVGAWIKANVDRVNFLLNSECGIPVLTLLESFLQCRLNPVFEGFDSQR